MRFGNILIPPSYWQQGYWVQFVCSTPFILCWRRLILLLSSVWPPKTLRAPPPPPPQARWIMTDFLMFWTGWVLKMAQTTLNAMSVSPRIWCPFAATRAGWITPLMSGKTKPFTPKWRLTTCSNLIQTLLRLSPTSSLWISLWQRSKPSALIRSIHSEIQILTACLKFLHFRSTLMSPNLSTEL